MPLSQRNQAVSASICAVKAAWVLCESSSLWSKSRSFNVTFGSLRSDSVAQRPRVEPFRSNLRVATQVEAL